MLRLKLFLAFSLLLSLSHEAQSESILEEYLNQVVASSGEASTVVFFNVPKHLKIDILKVNFFPQILNLHFA